MLDLGNILWVIPGVVFISIYNRRRPQQAINLSGWPYIFSLVIISTVTWLPAEFIIPFVYFGKIEILSTHQNMILMGLMTLTISLFFTFLLLSFFQSGALARLILPPVYDDFYTKCFEWKEKAVLLTLKNGKVYMGLLSGYTKNPRARYESQTISIVPFKSGYREMDKKRIVWTTDYPYTESYHDDMELILPRSEILTFGKFDLDAHKYFESLKN